MYMATSDSYALNDKRRTWKSDRSQQKTNLQVNTTANENIKKTI